MKSVGRAAGWIAICVPLVAGFEGLWLTAKVDRIGTGKPITWCYGETIGGARVGEQFTKQECDDKLAARLPKYHDEIHACIKVPVSAQEDAAYTSFAYNVGSSGAFCHSTALKKLNRGDRVGACKALLPYDRAGGVVVRGLDNRRHKEVALCLDGARRSVEPTELAPDKHCQLVPWARDCFTKYDGR